MIPLGSGRSAAAGCGNKARLLDEAALLGLPVPFGWVVPDRQEPRLRLRGSYAVRSAFSQEDGADQSLAGHFMTLLKVSADDLSTAVEQIRKSSHAVRKDVLIMAQIQPRRAGVAFTEAAFEDDLVEWVDGLADRLVSGQAAGESLELPKLRFGEDLQAGWRGRLQSLLAGVRREFGEGDWDIEWADDGRVCWLIQLRPITRACRRNEAFTVANHKEILPDPPSRLMASVIREASGQLFAFYRSFEPDLGQGRQVIELFEGRPLLNLSLFCDMMRRWGLPTTLVTDNIGGESLESFPLRPVRIWARATVHASQLLAQSHAVERAQTKMSEWSRPVPSGREAADDLVRTYAELVWEMFSLTSAMSGPMVVLAKTGCLAGFLGHHETISTTLYRDLTQLRQSVADKPEWGRPLRLGKAPDDPDFHKLVDAFFERHGHRGVYESDVARPRYHEQPEVLFKLLASPSTGSSGHRPRLDWRHRLLRPLWVRLRPVLAAREKLRYEAMRRFDRIRQELLAVPCPGGSIFDLSVEEVRRLEAPFSADFWTERSQLLARERQRPLPDLVYRFDPPEFQAHGNDLSGRGLTEGEVEGKAWVLTEPGTELPEGFLSRETILVAPSVDAGWIGAFGLVAGVVVETGGELSHGSIILREVGLPAITNVSGLMSALKTGDRIRMTADRGRIEKLEEVTG